jgi:hypothetical protein
MVFASVMGRGDPPNVVYFRPYNVKPFSPSPNVTALPHTLYDNNNPPNVCCVTMYQSDITKQHGNQNTQKIIAKCWFRKPAHEDGGMSSMTKGRHALISTGTGEWMGKKQMPS